MKLEWQTQSGTADSHLCMYCLNRTPNHFYVPVPERHMVRPLYFCSESCVKNMAELMNGITSVSACTCDSPQLVTHPGDEIFAPRSGCLKCNVWFDKPHLRRSIK